MNHRGLLESLSLADLIEPAEENEALERSDIERVLSAKNPIAAAALADIRRAAVSGPTVTYPVTLRVRAPGFDPPHEDATKVTHALADVGGIEATEMQLTGSMPKDAQLDQVIEIVQPVAAAQRDLPLRALTADDVIAIVRHDHISYSAVLGALAKAGVATLDWHPGGEASWEYSVLIEVHDERDEMVARRVVGVGALRPGEARTFTLRVEVLVPESSRLTAAS